MVYLQLLGMDTRGSFYFFIAYVVRLHDIRMQATAGLDRWV
jgi:hypothetical protein